MKIIKDITLIYEDLIKKAASYFGNQRTCRTEKYINKKLGGFTVTLEIVVSALLNEDDYGIVFSTNAQKMSHFEMKVKCNESELFLISDISYTDGAIIDSTKEFRYNMFLDDSSSQVLQSIKDFNLTKFDLVKHLLISKYKLIEICI